MGLGTKINLAFFAVILVMVLGVGGYSLFTDYQTSRREARRVLSLSIDHLKTDIDTIQSDNTTFAKQLLRNNQFIAAYASRNLDGVKKSVKELSDRFGLIGFTAIIDDKGNLLYSSETPTKSGIFVRDKGSIIDSALVQASPISGPAAFSPAGTVTLTSIIPFTTAQAVPGLITVNQPVDTEFLTGFKTKLGLLSDPLPNVAAALYSAKENRVVAFTQDLSGRDGEFLSKINRIGLKALPTTQQLFEADGRLWAPYPMGSSANNLIGVILLTTPLPNIFERGVQAALQAGIPALAGIVLALVCSLLISSNIRSPLRALMRRAQDLSLHKTSLPPLVGLSGEWLELAELMDTAVSSMRGSIQSLKSQMSNYSEAVAESKQDAEAAGAQLDNVNRELANKTRQLTELSKQINYANQQTILLQQKLDSVLQISTEGFLILDRFGNVLTANPVFLNWMGVTEGEIAGRQCFDLVKRPGEPTGANPFSRSFAKPTGEPTDLISQFYPEAVIHHQVKDRSVEVLAHLQPVMTDSSGIECYVMVLRDKSLRSEVAQLRTDIVTMLSDSIRQPLTSAEDTWKSILSKAGETLHPAVGQSLIQLHNHYLQLIGLVDSLLMIYGGIMPPAMIPKEPVVITRLIADCLEEVSATAREHQLMLDYKTVTGLPNIHLDREALRGVILQLLEKMIEVTVAGGRVRVESLIKGKEMRVGVTSSGPALSQEEIEDLFLGFIQERHSEETYSSRLSMYLVRNNVERLGGKIWAESQSGRGTAIFFTLPVR